MYLISTVIELISLACSGAAPVFDDLPATAVVLNDAVTGKLVFTVFMSDANTLDALSVSIVNTAPVTDKFVIDANTGMYRISVIHFMQQSHLNLI